MGNSVIEIRRGSSEELTADPVAAKKSIEAIDLQLMNRPMTYLQHRIYNVWIAYAQAYRNAEGVRIFSFPLRDVMEHAGYVNTRDYAHFIEAARSMMDLRVEYNSIETLRADRKNDTRSLGSDVIDMASPPASVTPVASSSSSSPSSSARGRSPKRGRGSSLKWRGTQLVSDVSIDMSTNTMTVEFPERFRAQILKPDAYRMVDLAKQSAFTSRAALALYEYVLRYAGDGESPRLAWQTYSMLLAGSPEPHSTFREFAKLLTRALKQVNEHHETHKVRAIAYKRSRSIETLQFKIEPKVQQTLQALPLVVDPVSGERPEPEEAVVRELMSFGLSGEEALRQASLYPAEYLREHMALVRKRLASKTQRKIDNPAGWLLTALAGNYVGAKKAIKAAKELKGLREAREGREGRLAVAGPSPGGAADLLRSERREGGPEPESAERIEGPAGLPSDSSLAWFSSQPAEVKQVLSAEFYGSASAVIQATMRKNPKSPIVRHALSEWLAQRPEFLAATSI